jgi:transposase InsO family protein
MSVRRLIVEVELDGLNVSAFCSQHQVSRWFFYDLRRRYARDGAGALEPRARAPRRVANRTSVEMEDRIVAMRKELVDGGWDAGPVSVHDALLDAGVEAVPSPSTIWRVLRRRGFVVAEPAKRPQAAMRRFVADRANECWQFDDTTWPLADGTEVKIINVLDDCTRVLIGTRAVATCTAEAVFTTLMDSTASWGMPERVLCDNAQAHIALHDTLGTLGIATRHSRPYHPQTCGKVERFHDTLKRWLRAHDSAATIGELQVLLDEFADHYNHRRRHRALGRRVPADVWAATPKSGPATHPLAATTVHRIVIAANGVAYAGAYRGASYAIHVGRNHAGRPAVVVITGRACHVFINARLARTLTLDPAQRSQPSTRTHLP